MNFVDERLLGSDLLGLAARAEADEPADDVAAVGAGLVGGSGAGVTSGGRGRRRWRWPPRLAAAWLAAVLADGDVLARAAGGRQDGDDAGEGDQGARAGSGSFIAIDSSSARSCSISTSD